MSPDEISGFSEPRTCAREEVRRRICPRCKKNQVAKRFCFGVCGSCYNFDRYNTDPEYRARKNRRAKERLLENEESYNKMRDRVKRWQQNNPDKVKEFNKKTRTRRKYESPFTKGKVVTLVDGRKGVVIDPPMRFRKNWIIVLQFGTVVESVCTSQLTQSRSSKRKPKTSM